MKYDGKLNAEKNVYKRILMDSGHYKDKVNDYYFIFGYVPKPIKYMSSFPYYIR